MWELLSCENSEKDVNCVNRLKDHPLESNLDHMAERHVSFWSIWYKSNYEWTCLFFYYETHYINWRWMFGSTYIICRGRAAGSLTCSIVFSSLTAHCPSHFGLLFPAHQWIFALPHASNTACEHAVGRQVPSGYFLPILGYVSASHSILTRLEHLGELKSEINIRLN